MATRPAQITRHGQLYQWTPEYTPEKVRELTDYAGLSAEQLGLDPSAGSYTPASFANPGGLSPWKAIGLLAGAGTPAGALSFASFMHPENQALKYGALAAGAYQGFGGNYGGLTGPGGLPGGGSSGPRPLPVTQGLPDGLGTPITLPGMATGAGSAMGPTAAQGASMPWYDFFTPGDNKFDILDAIGLGGKFATGMGNDRQADRILQQNYNDKFDRAERERAALLNQQIRLDLDQREYQDQALRQALQDRLRGSLLQHAQNAEIRRPDGRPVPQVTGAFDLAAMPNRVQVGQDLERSATERMLNPAKLPALPEIPETSTTGVEPTGLDTALGIFGTIGGAVDTYREATKKPATPPAPIAALPPVRRGFSASSIDLMQPGSLPYMTNYTDLSRKGLGDLDLRFMGGRDNPLARQMGITQPVSPQTRLYPRPARSAR